MLVLAVILLARSANLERQQLEVRLLQVAHTLADDVDRELSNLSRPSRRSATSPSLQSDNLAAFHGQAVAVADAYAAHVKTRREGRNR